MNRVLGLLIFYLLPLLLISLLGTQVNNQVETAGNSSRVGNYWDPSMESGFPVQSYQASGGTIWNESPSTIVGNFDDDPESEIASGSIGNLSLYLWNPDSSLKRGWPPNNNYFLSFPAAGNLSGDGNILEIVATFDHAAIVAYDKGGNPLAGWPREFLGWGHISPALADIDGDGIDEIFFDIDDGKIYGLDSDGTDLPNWPVVICNSAQSAHTPAIVDLDGDGDLEILAVGDMQNSLNSLCAYHHTGQPVEGFPIAFYGYSFVFPVIGDVDGDSEREIVLNTAPFGISIYSSTGELERNIPLQGTTSYGNFVALGDIDHDGLPEIAVSSDDTLYVLKGDGTILPGWPVDLPLPPDFSIAFSYLVLLGDIDGDSEPDVITSRGDTYAFDKFGHLLSGFPKPGVALAINDIDLDGRNELITLGDVRANDASYVFPDQINVYDLGGGVHGKVEWGQFGGGPSHRHVYPIPPISSPPLVDNGKYHSYLAMIADQSYSNPDKPGIYGLITYLDQPAPSIPVELRFFDGSSWSTYSQINTDLNGEYWFTNIPSLSEGQAYYIRYVKHAPGYLENYSTRLITHYQSGTELGITDFDLADFYLVYPADGSTVNIPENFEADERTNLPTDRYSFVLYDPQINELYLNWPFQSAAISLIGLPPGFLYGTEDLWSFWAISPENALGIPTEIRSVTFENQDLLESQNIASSSDFALILDILELYRICEKYPSLMSCNPLMINPYEQSDVIISQ